MRVAWELLRQSYDDLYKKPGADGAGTEEVNRFQTLYEECNTLCEVYNMPLLRENDSLMSLNLALSQISIPEIYGEYLDWPRFHDLFLELVHNKTYSASQRLHILQGSIRGEE
ncbi:uncharacterized protein LOC122818584 isoform X1 [Drosophila biarmipes]|uniref:uncharacterized protein LOC122818584 isoform X2 n=1 Tax=Drosophila biarmipes TaxID=125945 RepID=UPI001CDB3543|nr:uncharacterized protein LOC122818584 isoform X2 [Drosophila biarmipes]XP_043948717.1 uncharacterized protein LOC122818586 isoform X1 [Drosophila biarmipes]XP_043948719.1 uncharacterized protein LOC122818587 isoform X1 [Drosophila biarmipes]XP_043948721.1 uncharacterized protein LOC122818584 isoform X1 [Drosophila biarmipes]